MAHRTTCWVHRITELCSFKYILNWITCYPCILPTPSAFYIPTISFLLLLFIIKLCWLKSSVGARNIQIHTTPNHSTHSMWVEIGGSNIKTGIIAAEVRQCVAELLQSAQRCSCTYMLRGDCNMYSFELCWAGMVDSEEIVKGCKGKW